MILNLTFSNNNIYLSYIFIILSTYTQALYKTNNSIKSLCRFLACNVFFKISFEAWGSFLGKFPPSLTNLLSHRGLLVPVGLYFDQPGKICWVKVTKQYFGLLFFSCQRKIENRRNPISYFVFAWIEQTKVFVNIYPVNPAMVIWFRGEAWSKQLGVIFCKR